MTVQLVKEGVKPVALANIDKRSWIIYFYGVRKYRSVFLLDSQNTFLSNTQIVCTPQCLYK